ncbi:MAG TPA: ATP-binding protein [Blastocatellia bacterium]|jgi:nitrogen fixation/metabolism regulation signal transduction histidine kinase|nr:ATP-binding protein [Blastocatellia bacterium]
MSLRLKFALYLVVIHVLFAGVAVYLLLNNRIWLLAVEAIFVLSLVAGIRLIRSLFGTIEMINTGAQFIGDSDFTSRFREVGQPEMDRLIHIYNRMVDHLREERTRQQEQHYFLDKILKASPSGILTLDLDGRVAMANPAAERMLQSSNESIFGKRLSEFDSPFFLELNELATGDSRVIALQGRRRIKCQKSQFLDRGFPRIFILMEELTEELRQTEKSAYEKLIRMMSHEVNNSVGSANSLLHSCLNYKDQLREDDRKDFEMALSVVISRTDHLNAFMRSFADVVRLPPPKLLPCNVEELLEDISLLMRADTARREIEWVWDLQAPRSYIAMDRSQMEQVFVNIFKNAIEAIGSGGTITVRTGEKNGRRFVVIEDTGSGISPEARSRLFSPFFSTKENGQGIGLTMVQEILDQHHFEFFLESEPGHSTQFRIYF